MVIAFTQSCFLYLLCYSSFAISVFMAKSFSRISFLNLKCTQPMEKSQCPDCGKVLGGEGHKFLGEYKISDR